MKQIKTKSKDIICVEVPEDTTWWSIIENKLGNFITKELDLPQQFLQYGKSSNIFGSQWNNQVYYNPDNFYLPKGKWEILGKLYELTDKDCEEFVEKMPFSFSDRYLLYIPYLYSPEHTKSAKESFMSLLQSEGIDTSKELLIIKIL